MLIKLTPAFPASTVLFATTFPEFNEGLPVPSSWANQLNQLSMDDLEHPKALHALDKAACIPNILEEVSFDIPTLTITCRFYDGTAEEWPLMGVRCMQLLQGILDDVNEYTQEMEREREEEIAERERERKRIEALSSPQSTGKPRHKRQRSLLMTLVASLVIPLSSASSSSSQPPLPSPPPTPQRQDSSFLEISHRALRWRARSALVDAFRRYVLPEIKPRLPPGGYYAWVVRSTLRRVSERMGQLTAHAGMLAPQEHPLPGPGYFPNGTSSVPPSPFYSDEDEADTDTDGSSVHTPTSSHVTTPRRTFRASPFPERPPNLLQQYLSSNDMEEYAALSDMRDRLRQLQHLHAAQQAHERTELAHHHEMLEVRSRRRAWLNKALVGGTHDLGLGLATPFRSSPLARGVFYGDEYEFCPDAPAPAVEYEYADYEERMSAGLRRTRLSTEARLFPVSEEDGEEDDDVRELELELGFGLDLEDGMAWREELEEEEEVMRGTSGGVRVAFELERPQIRPRVRTSSMHQPNAQPLHAKDLVRAPMPFYGGGDEFTLAMDIPFSVRVQDRSRGVFSKEDDHGWISSDDDAFDCR